MENETSVTQITQTCSHVKVSGQRCLAARLRDSDLCFWHSPEVVTQRLEARRRGGLNRFGPRGEPGEYVISTPADILTVLEAALNDCWALPNTQGRARTIGFLCGVLLRGFEVSELDTRIRSLEDRIFRGK